MPPFPASPPVLSIPLCDRSPQSGPRTNVAHIRQSRPDSGRGVKANALERLLVFPLRDLGGHAAHIRQSIPQVEHGSYSNPIRSEARASMHENVHERMLATTFSRQCRTFSPDFRVMFRLKSTGMDKMCIRWTVSRSHWWLLRGKGCDAVPRRARM